MSRTLLRSTTMALGSLALLGGLAGSAAASDPATSTVADNGTASYTGSVPVGTDPGSTCLNVALGDNHAITYSGPSATGEVTVKINWMPVANAMTSDLILSVFDAAGTDVGDSDGSDPSESVTFSAAKGATYTAEACGYVNAQPQAYTGSITVAAPVAAAGQPPAPQFPAADGGTGTSPVVPEVPLAALLPIAALAVGGVGFGVLRARRA